LCGIGAVRARKGTASYHPFRLSKCTNAWQKASGYTRRAKAETGISRFKQVIGDGLRLHTDQRQATEVGVAVHVLNRMLELGRPNSVRIA